MTTYYSQLLNGFDLLESNIYVNFEIEKTTLTVFICLLNIKIFETCVPCSNNERYIFELLVKT